jgi:putative lipoprotein
VVRGGSNVARDFCFRRTTCVTLGALIWLSPLGVRAADPDPFWGRDKALHFGASAAIAAGGYAVGTGLWDERWKAIALGGGIALGAGALKEGLDAAGLGHPSWNDFAWDAIGAACGTAVALVVDMAVHGGRLPPIVSSTSALDVRF